MALKMESLIAVSTANSLVVTLVPTKESKRRHLTVGQLASHWAFLMDYPMKVDQYPDSIHKNKDTGALQYHNCPLVLALFSLCDSQSTYTVGPYQDMENSLG